MISKDDTAFFKDLLRSQLVELERKADGTVSSLLISSVYTADPLDSASLESERNVTLRIRDRESKLIEKSRMPSIALKRGHTGSAIFVERISPLPGSV